MSTVRRITILVLGTLLVLGAGAALETSAGQPVPPPAQPTALLVSATNAPLRVLGSDGMEHLEYDLIITNVFIAPVTVTTVEVIAPDGRTLLRLEGDTLAANTQPLFFSSTSPGSQIPVGGGVATVIDLVLPPGQVPARISHRIAYELPPDAPALTLFDSRVVTGPELTVDPRVPLVIAPPLRGAGWFNINGCCAAATPHRAVRLAVDGARVVKMESFAIDWLRLQDGRLFTGDGAQNEQHFAFGAEIVSVADGTVVDVRDDLPDEMPGQPPVAVQHPQDYAGNLVVVQIQPGVWAIYAHFQPGSVAVRVGERVTTGQLLGRLGSSGNSDAPHLHFQLSDGPDVITSNSLPFVFDRYTLAGTVDAEALAAVITDPSAPAVRIEGPPQAQTGTYPLFGTVQDFPGSHAAAHSAAVAGPGDVAGLVEIGGGRRMYLECRGQGAPTVVLVSGYGNHGGVWSVDSPEVPQPQVMSAVAGFTRVCAYDRPGTVGFDLDDPADRSRSDPIPQPTTAAAAVDDLHALLRAAAVPGPFVLVGHSLGGLFTRLFAATYPDEVAGMVLVDAMSERFRAVLTPEEWAASLEIFQSPSMLPQLAAYRDYERIDFDAVFDEMLRATAARPLRPTPLVVLSAGVVPDTSELGLNLPPGFQEAFTAAARANQAFQARLLPDARQVIVTEAGHYIQVEQPEAVIEAIRQVVTAVRDPASWPRAATGEGSDRIAWQPCATGELPTRECGELVVPVSYREPEGATISLAVARVPASDQAGRIGSLFLNPGGPGQPGFEELAIMYAPLPEPIRAQFDIVGFDPRGVGESAPVRCFDSPEEQATFFAAVPRVPVGAAEEAALLRSYQELGRRCAERNAALLPHLSTFNVAQDLDRLRQAVGDQRLNYWGVSYGTYLGATYANLFPDHIRAMVLDGVINPPSYTSFDHGDGSVVGPDTTSFLRVLSNQGSEDTFGQFIDLCAAAGVAHCAFAAPSAAETRAKLDALMRRLRAHPAILIGPAGTLTVTYPLVIESVWQLLYQPPTWPILAQALQHLHEGDTAGFLVALEALGWPPSTVYRNPSEALTASNCVDTDNPADPALFPAMARAAEERTPYFGALWTYVSLPCAFWPAQDVDRYRGPWDAPTSAAILLLSRRFDPATPHGGAEAASRTLANARLLTIDGWGHGYYLAGKSTCADDAASAYFISGELSAVGTVCPEDAPPFGD